MAWRRDNIETEEDYLDQVLGVPTRFTDDDLKAITVDFNKKLGQGGLWSISKGTLIDGIKVASEKLQRRRHMFTKPF